MSQDIESFRALCADPRNAVIKARWHEIAERCVAEAEAKGVKVSSEQLLEIPTIRIAAVSGDMDTMRDWEAEAKLRLPAWKAYAETVEAYQSLQDTAHAGHDDAAAKFAAMSPIERMRAARAAGHSLPKANEERKPLSDAERARLSEKLSAMDVSPAMRLKLAREWGL